MQRFRLSLAVGLLIMSTGFVYTQAQDKTPQRRLTYSIITQGDAAVFL